MLVVLVWLPDSESYVASYYPPIQSDGEHGYTVKYYSRVQFPSYLHSIGLKIPPFVKRTVAMSGHKKFGFTPIKYGDVIGRTKINWSGFIILWILSAFIFYLTHILGKFLKTIPNKKHNIKKRCD
ncbi:MAG: hypothetical protein LBC68_05700 [Prevotellaceae bacterium]|nr:hypothetical protein [Prevotellaceae bacterium]